MPLEARSPQASGTDSTEPNDYIARMIAGIREKSELRMRIMQEVHLHCPGPCEDGRLHCTLPTGEHASTACWFMAPDCAYGIAKRRELREHFVEVLTQTAIPAIHKLALATPKPTEALVNANVWDFKHRPILLLLGPKGVGKSYAAACAFVRWFEAKTPADLWRHPERWNDMARDAERALCWMHIYKLVNDRDSTEAAAKAPFLVLDDLASEDATPGAKARVNYIISERYDALKPTVLTGNLGVKEFVARYGERIMDRIAHFGTIANCTGENLREKG